MNKEIDVTLHYRMLKLIEDQPLASQRQLAAELGLSLGKVNYCLQALISKGLVKAGNFKNSDHKWAYTYLLTPCGIKEKARVTWHFFRRVEAEYATLCEEVAHLRAQGFDDAA